MIGMVKREDERELYRLFWLPDKCGKVRLGDAISAYNAEAARL